MYYNKQKIIAIHQPNFLPYAGYFYKMSQCEIFVLLDDAQFSKDSFTVQNQINSNNGPIKLKVPIKYKGSSKKPIHEIELNFYNDWRTTHLELIKETYKSSINYDKLFPKIKKAYNIETNSLSVFNINLISLIRDQLGINNNMVLSSELRLPGYSTQKLVNICKHLGGTIYLSGQGGKNYMDINLFNKNGIKLEYMVFNQSPYMQHTPSFIPNMSIIDFLFHTNHGTSISI